MDINPIFKRFYAKDIDPASVDDQIRIQKIIYLIENMGIRIGNYNYVWSKHGPYSCDLQREIFAKHKKRNIVFSSKMIEMMDNIKLILDSESKYSKYSDKDLLELIVSLHYVKFYEHNTFISDEDVIMEVMERKKHLNNKKRNEEIMKTIVLPMIA